MKNNDLALLPPAPDLAQQLAERQQHLRACAAQLKTELFGIDEVIDRVIDSVRTWYVLPQCITRPVIVCLWGLTGTGKTQLVRRLAQLLGFYDRFVEVQMDGFSNGGGRRSSIANMLSDSDIDEGAPGILVLDEFQRYRTVDNQGGDAKVERYQDVWALLSDGRLPPAIGMLGDIEYQLADAQYDAERVDDDEPEGKTAKQPKRFRLTVWEARDIKSTLKLQEPLEHIMQWSPERIQQLLVQFRRSQHAWETDYSRLLIFVCGNLDEMYRDTAQSVEDCDTDADIFHRLTSKLSLIDVKKALAKRFKPEQIARLGNIHVIYPSLARSTYERLIANLCQRYIQDMAQQTGVQFVLEADLRQALYANAVFPAQGTRPLFSSVHGILGTTLVNAALWALQAGADLARPCTLTLASSRQHVLAQAHAPDGTVLQECFATTFDLERVKSRTNADFRALVAVHEAGHALVYALLFGRAPQEVKINIASFEGGYNSYVRLKAKTRQNALDKVCTTLAGRAAENWVFGNHHATSGSESDLTQATEDASHFIRYHGFGGRLSRTDVADEPNEHVNTDVMPSNEAIEALLQEQYERASALLHSHVKEFQSLVDALLHQGNLESKDMVALMQNFDIALQMPPSDDDKENSLVLAPFAQQLAQFRAQQGADFSH